VRCRPVGQFFVHVTDSGRFRSAVTWPFQGLQHAIGGLDAIVGDVAPNVADVLRSTRGKDEWPSSLGSFLLGASLPYFRKDFRAVNEFVPVGLPGSHGDFLAQFGKP
jgi:hypothetical protein